MFIVCLFAFFFGYENCEIKLIGDDKATDVREAAKIYNQNMSGEESHQLHSEDDRMGHQEQSGPFQK